MKANDECRRISNEKDTLQDKVMQLNNEVIKLELELKTNHVSFRHACNTWLWNISFNEWLSLTLLWETSLVISDMKIIVLLALSLFTAFYCITLCHCFGHCVVCFQTSFEEREKTYRDTLQSLESQHQESKLQTTILHQQLQYVSTSVLITWASYKSVNKIYLYVSKSWCYLSFGDTHVMWRRSFLLFSSEQLSQQLQVLITGNDICSDDMCCSHFDLVIMFCWLAIW